MYIYIQCIYISLYISIYLSIHPSIHPSIFLSLSIYIYIHSYTHIHIHIQIHIHTVRDNPRTEGAVAGGRRLRVKPWHTRTECSLTASDPTAAS